MLSFPKLKYYEKYYEKYYYNGDGNSNSHSSCIANCLVLPVKASAYSNYSGLYNPHSRHSPQRNYSNFFYRYGRGIIKASNERNRVYHKTNLYSGINNHYDNNYNRYRFSDNTFSNLFLRDRLLGNNYSSNRNWGCQQKCVWK